MVSYTGSIPAERQVAMARVRYVPEDLGSEVTAPSGYYQPLEEGFIEHEGRRLLFTLGRACIDSSCCGVGSWEYLRVEGYVVGSVPPADDSGDAGHVEIETVEDPDERAVLSRLLLERYPGVRVEFR